MDMEVLFRLLKLLCTSKSVSEAYRGQAGCTDGVCMRRQLPPIEGGGITSALSSADHGDTAVSQTVCFVNHCNPLVS